MGNELLGHVAEETLVALRQARAKRLAGDAGSDGVDKLSFEGTSASSANSRTAPMSSGRACRIRTPGPAAHPLSSFRSVIGELIGGPLLKGS